MKIAYIFPGQGSQIVGMGADIYNTYESARKIFDVADRTLGMQLRNLCFNGPQETLNLTVNTQPALLTVSAAIATVLKERVKIKPIFCAGHSLGEYTAHWFANTFDFPTAVKLVRDRGHAMQMATPPGVGAMAAIVGLGSDEVIQICTDVSNGWILEAANFNSPGQVVISGHKEAIDRGMDIAKERGAKKCILLPVSAPFHSKLMDPAAAIMKEKLADIHINPPEIPIVNNADAATLQTDSQSIKDSLVRQITAPVKWEQSIYYMISQGVDTFVEIGSGRILSNLVKRISRDCEIISVSSVDSMDAFLQRIV
ncbi:ACP S-malonyltransferase [bacterium]|nr:ACP S-malonyltransferase [candidate division CSSED10-310 bacterium]